MRFSAFNKKQTDARFWLIQYFESFVVFHINKKLSSEASKSLINNGINDRAGDYRHHNNKFSSLLEKI
jgi:hypothetical protein